MQLKADEKSLDGPSGTGGRLHRPARLVRGVSCLVPAGWGSTRPRACLPARATSRSPATPFRPAAASPIERLQSTSAETEFELSQTSVTRIHEDAARHASPTATTSNGPRCIDALGKHGRRANSSPRTTCASRWVASPPSSSTSDDVHSAAVEHRGADGAHQARLARGRPDCVKPARRPSRLGGVLHHGQGKWYPGEPLPRWAKTMLSGAPGRPADAGATRRCFAAPERSLGHAIQDARHFAKPS